MTHKETCFALPHLQSHYDVTIWVIYSKAGVFWGIMTKTFRPLSHQCFFFLFFGDEGPQEDESRIKTHTWSRKTCSTYTITPHPRLSDSFRLRSLRSRAPHGRSFGVWQYFKNGENTLITVGKGIFLPVDFGHSTVTFSVYMLARVVQSRLEELRWKDRREV